MDAACHCADLRDRNIVVGGASSVTKNNVTTKASDQEEIHNTTAFPHATPTNSTHHLYNGESQARTRPCGGTRPVRRRLYPVDRLGGRDCARKSYGFWHRNSFDLPGALASGIPDAGASGGRYPLALLSRSYDVRWSPREREVTRGFPRSLPLRAAELGPDFSPAFNFSSYKPLF